MEPAAKKNGWRGGWAVPLSALLHVLIVAVFYLQWPDSIEAPAEPESVSVELVEPPKEEPPKPEEKKAQEPPPPAEKPPPSPRPVQPPTVAVRPSPTQLDERDQPAEQDAGGEEQPKSEERADESRSAAAAAKEPAEERPAPQPLSMEATAAQGEIPASETVVSKDVATVAVPAPKPELKQPSENTPKVLPDGSDDARLKPAKKILATGKRPRPMLRQILGDLPPRERVGQLCVAEAMAQIKETKGPYDGLEPHTGKTYPVAGNVMDAQGAFNVGTQWFPIHYRCEVDIDNYMVTGFRYYIGPKLSPDDVKRLKLAAG